MVSPLFTEINQPIKCCRQSQPIEFLMNNFLASVDIKTLFAHEATHLQRCFLLSSHLLATPKVFLFSMIIIVLTVLYCSTAESV